MKDELRDRVTVANTDEYARYMWIRIRTGAPPLRDIFIAVCYFPPTASPFAIHDGVERDPFTNIYPNITKYSADGEIIIMGDFNARTKDHQVLLHDRSEDVFCTRGVDLASVGLQRISEDALGPITAYVDIFCSWANHMS